MFYLKIILIVSFTSITLYAQKEYQESQKLKQRWLDSIFEIEDNETRQTVSEHILADFGLKVYKDNYIIVGYREGKYENYTVTDTYTNKEAEM